MAVFYPLAKPNAKATLDLDKRRKWAGVVKTIRPGLPKIPAPATQNQNASRRWVETLGRQGDGRRASNANPFNAFLGLAASQARLNESSKQGMCQRRLRFELRV